MDSKKYLGLVEAYSQVYEQQKIGIPLKDSTERAAKDQLQKMIPKGEKVHTFGKLQNAHFEPKGQLVEDYQEFFNSAVEFFVETNVLDSLDEIDYFLNSLIEEDLCYTFLDDLLEFCSYGSVTEEYINEVSAGLLARGLKAAGGVFKKATPAVRGLSAKTLAKQGITPGGMSQTGSILRKVNKPALGTQTRAIQQARAARQVGIPQPNQGANRYLDMLTAKKASAPKAPETKGFVQRGWERHTAAGGPDPSKIVKRAQTDTAIAAMVLGAGQMAGLPVAKTLGMAVPKASIARTAAPRIVSAPNLSMKSASKVLEPDPWSQQITNTIKGASKTTTQKTAGTPRLSGAKVQQPAGLLSPAKASKGTGLVKSQKAPSGMSSTKIEPVKVEVLPSQSAGKVMSGAKVQQPAGLLAPGKPAKTVSQPDFKHMVAPSIPRSGRKVSGKTPGPGGGSAGTGLSNKVKLAMAAGGLATLGTAAALTSGKKDDDRDPNASVNKYNTMDPDGTVRDRLKVGPKKVGPKIVGPGSSRPASTPTYTKTSPSSQTDKEESKSEKPQSQTKPTNKKEKLSDTVKDLMSMRAASLERQGKTKEAREVRDEIERKNSSK